MNDEKVRTFISLTGRTPAKSFGTGTESDRRLGAQLLLSEVLEYVIHGLGVVPELNGMKITDPEALSYAAVEDPNREAMLDGLADVAYTMYWNSVTFGAPLEAAYDHVCDNNLEKFVLLQGWAEGEGSVSPTSWALGRDVSWPADVVSVEVVKIDREYYGVGKDARGKVRKPSTYRSVDLSAFLGS
jgi:hypothetical protein